VYRVFEAVPHVNLLDVEATRLYTVYQSGYADGRQALVDDLRTGDLVDATLFGDPDADDEAWSLRSVERVGGVRMRFVVDAAVPAVVADRWEPGADRPVGTTLTTADRDALARDDRATGGLDADAHADAHADADEGDADGDPVGAAYLQPREPLPDGAFVRSVLTGLVPMESTLRALPGVGAPATDAVFVDPDPAGADAYRRPYGAVLLFGDVPGADALLDAVRDRYGLPADRSDTRPSYDPYR
jgi:hypothetical protein